MNLTGLALRNLRRRPIRTGLSILGSGWPSAAHSR